MTRVVGLDLSLTATGVAIAEMSSTRVTTLRSKGKADDALITRGYRLHSLAAQIFNEVYAGLEDDLFVAVEQPAYNQTGGSHHDRSGLWWLVVDGLDIIFSTQRLEVIEVSPTTVKKYATGRGNASKDEVLAAVVRRYPGVPVANNNEADSLVLAAIASRLIGRPLEDDLPKANLAAMEALRPKLGQ